MLGCITHTKNINRVASIRCRSSRSLHYPGPNRVIRVIRVIKVISVIRLIRVIGWVVCGCGRSMAPLWPLYLLWNTYGPHYGPPMTPLSPYGPL